MKIKRKILLVFFIIGGILPTAQAQKSWLIKAELGGGALTYQLGAAREWNRWQLSLGIGQVFLLEAGTETRLSVTTLPIQLLHVFPLGEKGHGMELGLGITNLIMHGDLLESGGSTQWHLNPHALLQYRYAPSGKHWQLRAGIQPVLGTRSLLDPTWQAFSPFGLRVLPMPMLGVAYRL